MQKPLPVLLTTVLLTWPGQPPMAQPPRSAPPATRGPRATSYVSLIKKRNGDRALAIRYPWKVHLRPSVEIRIVTGKDVEPRSIRPRFFLSEYMKGEATVAIYRCQDKASGVPVRETLTANDLDLEIVGRRNWLGRPAVYVLERPPADGPRPGTAAAFCLLDAWALNRRLLYLDLPPEDFAERGKMYVWFLRDEKLLWTETVDWPGYPKQEAAEPE